MTRFVLYYSGSFGFSPLFLSKVEKYKCCVVFFVTAVKAVKNHSEQP